MMIGVAFLGPMYPTIPHIDLPSQGFDALIHQAGALDELPVSFRGIAPKKMVHVTWDDLVPPVARVFIILFLLEGKTECDISGGLPLMVRFSRPQSPPAG
jgi:hypothetical protein